MVVGFMGGFRLLTTGSFTRHNGTFHKKLQPFSNKTFPFEKAGCFIQ